jgi:tetratricopeptide (TPR) repeat protein
MLEFPNEPKKIRARIRRYERKLRKEYEATGFYGDGYGKRYLLGPLYLLMGDLEGALKSFEWFAQTFPDDTGEPIQNLCWALALYRSGNLAEATLKLRQAMLSNLYLIPRLLGIAQDKLDIAQDELDFGYYFNLFQKEDVEYMPPEIWALWDEVALQWAEETYYSPGFQQVRDRFIEIQEQLKSEPRGPKRSELVDEAFRLQGW